jgi:hypothetical protein
MQPLLEITANSIELLEKAAVEADGLELRVRELEAENKRLQQQVKVADARPVIDQRVLLKLAQCMADENMLIEDMTAEKLASHYAQAPEQLAILALNLLRPMTTDGQPYKVAGSQTPNSPNAPKTVTFDGRQLVDNDGWSKVLR